MTDRKQPIPDPSVSHPSLDDEINNNIAQSEIEGGVHIDEMANGTILRIRMADHVATLAKFGEDDYYIWGHPKFYPQPVKIRLDGSTWGGMALKRHFIGRGIRLVFILLNRPPDLRTIGEYLIDYNGITTAPILDIEEVEPTAA